jgi:hypothetical protein
VVWCGRDAVLVCIGDLIDKWDHSVELIALVRQLQASAQAGGGRVLVTLGNHEQEFLADPSDKECELFCRELERLGLDPHEVAAGRDRLGIGAWLRNLPVAAKIADWFFVHAGNTGGLTVSDIETKVRAGVAKDGFAAPILAAPDSMLNTKPDEDKHWRGDEAHKTIKTVTEALGVNHLVQGHVPGKVEFGDHLVRERDQVFHAFGPRNDRFWMIDAGVSRGADGRGALVHVTTDADGGDVTALDVRGTVTLLDLLCSTRRPSGA